MTEIDLAKYEVTAWGKNKDFKKPFEFTTPSGQLTLLKRLDMGDILKLGVADELDFMTKALVADDPKPGEAEGESTSIIQAMVRGDNFDKMEKSINVVCAAGVIAPKLHPVPMLTKTENGKTIVVPNDNARQEGLLYVDAIPFNDRLVLFGEIFETEGLTDFREEPAAGVGDVPNVSDVPLPTE